MIPDFDHDGDIDVWDYFDDIGGALHFAPDESKRNMASGSKGWAKFVFHLVLEIALWIAFPFITMWLLFKY